MNTLGIQVIRFKKDQQEHWGVVDGDQILVLKETYSSLAHFLKKGKEEARNLKKHRNTESISLHKVEVLSPVTKPARIICQGANYASHRTEAGLEAARPPFNMFFSKADSSLCGAYSEIIRPNHVQLLDYEIELGLIIGANISSPVEVTDENLHQYIAGIVIVNDVSARDIQFSQGQWLKGKSYRTFTPTGPFFYLFDQEDVSYVHDLELNLWVNEELRQSANSEQLLYKPAETLTELTEIMDLSIGDLVMTGTTGGVALNISSEIMDQMINPAIPGQQKLELLIESQRENTKYLQNGDTIRSQIKSSDGVINLGVQLNKVVESKEKVTI
jgi:2-keto-4-pentenoate hydratase/2-oxohepta-3-ene-1,7-dioic acid hydratase in catechol pathway